VETISYGPNRAPAENGIRYARADYNDYLLSPPIRDGGTPYEPSSVGRFMRA
jgi:hypothetical protein